MICFATPWDRAIVAQRSLHGKQTLQRQLLLDYGKRAVMFGLFVGVYALAFPPLVLSALAVCCVVFAALATRRRIHWIGIAVAANFACWMLSGTISGALAAGMFASKEFWRGEGRCFLFYMPLLYFSVVTLKGSDLRFVVRLLGLLTIAGLLLATLWMAGWGHFFQAHVDPETGVKVASRYFLGLQTSHTGAGTFWAVTTAFLAAFSLREGNRGIQLLALGAALLTIATGGRAATLGLLAALGWLFFHLRGALPRVWGKLIAGGSLAGMGIVTVLSVSPEIGDRMKEVFEGSTVKAVMAAAEEPRLENAAGHFHSGAGLANHNLVIRIFLWKYALRLWGESPLLGVGFGRFNDTDLQFSGIPGVLQLAVDGERFAGCGIRWERGQRMTSVGNAHNSCLHTLAETGVVGLLMLLYLWWMLYRTADPRNEQGNGFSTAYCAGCRAAVVCLVTASLFGHALAAPSGGILVTTIIGAWIASQRCADAAHPRTVHIAASATCQ